MFVVSGGDEEMSLLESIKGCEIGGKTFLIGMLALCFSVLVMVQLEVAFGFISGIILVWVVLSVFHIDSNWINNVRKKEEEKDVV